MKDWQRAKKKLIKIYKKKGITRCEVCGGNFALSFHHLNKRSSGKAENTYKGTRLLCAKCHDKADNQPGFKQFNEMLKELR
jgi:5-methylcytosine-specific restriction endonuclease McrA